MISYTIKKCRGYYKISGSMQIDGFSEGVLDQVDKEYQNYLNQVPFPKKRKRNIYFLASDMEFEIFDIDNDTEFAEKMLNLLYKGSIRTIPKKK